MPSNLSDSDLEQRLRELAVEEDAELVVQQRADGSWTAAFKNFSEDVAPAALAPEGVTVAGAESDTRRGTLEDFLTMLEAKAEPHRRAR